MALVVVVIGSGSHYTAKSSFPTAPAAPVSMASFSLGGVAVFATSFRVVKNNIKKIGR